MHDSLDELLQLEYEWRFNWRKAVALCFAVVSLISAIIFLHSVQYWFVGIVAAVITVRLLMGSPLEEHLTEETLQRLRSPRSPDSTD